MKPQLVIFDTDAELIQQLKPQSAHLPYVHYAVGDGLTVTKAEKLDALKVSLMMALERFGWNPPYPPFQARVLKTPPADVQRGMPRYGISGVALPKDYPRDDPRRELEIGVSAMLKAVKEFNDRGEDQILRVGMLPENLSLDKLPPGEVFQMLERIYEELIAA
jgi:hypothetical protein